MSDAGVLTLAPTVVCCDTHTALHKVREKRAAESSLQNKSTDF